MRTRRWGAALVVTVGLLASACSGGSSGGSSGGGTGGGGSSADVNMTIQGYAFHPSTIQGSAGQTITIAISNKDSVEHSFTLNDDSVSKDFEPGDSGTVQVALPDSGTIGWHCEYHPQTMKGTIEIS